MVDTKVPTIIFYAIIVLGVELWQINTQYAVKKKN